MSHYIEKVTVSLENLISELARNPSLFLKNPDTDFSRNRKINFKTCVGITMNSGGCTLNKELLDFFDFDVNAPTVSAYTQQRAKILPEAFEYLFHAFTEENAQTKNLYEGYQLLACDGSNLTIAPNLNDPETLWKSNQLGATGNHLHLNALYDVLNRTYIDALVQTASTYQEHRACRRTDLCAGNPVLYPGTQKNKIHVTSDCEETDFNRWRPPVYGYLMWISCRC